MREVAIVGAGELGGAVAHVLARRDARPFDRARRRERPRRRRQGARHRAGRAGRRFCDTHHRNDGSRDRRGQFSRRRRRACGRRRWPGDEGLLLLKRLVQSAPRAVFLCAGPSSRELVERGVRELRIDRRRLFGSAPEALAAGARALVALSVERIAARRRALGARRPAVPHGDSVGGRDDRRFRADASARRAGAACAGRADCPRCGRRGPTRSRRRRRRSSKRWPVDRGERRAVSSRPTPAPARARVPPRYRCDSVPQESSEVILPTLSVVEQVALDNAMML